MFSISVVGAILMCASFAHGASVTLRNGTATFSQGPFVPGEANDGATIDDRGWAIAEPIITGDRTHAQILVFETAANLTTVADTDVTFTLSQQFASDTNPYHVIGKFRLSATTDDRSTFADGLANAGDVTADWTVLAPLTAVSLNGATIAISGDNSMLVSATLPATDVYTITSKTNLQGITGFRLEVLDDATLPFDGPGRHPDNGNFVLTEFAVNAMPVAAVPEPATWVMMSAGLVLLGAGVRRARPPL